MKNWKFIKVENTAHSDKVDVIKRLLAGGWSVEDIYSLLKTEGYEVEKGFIEKLKVGNKRYFTVEEEGGNSQNFSSLSEARSFADKWRSEGKQTVHIFEIEENDKDPDDFRVVRTINSSIQSQEWSMFKGLAKDAEKEVGNSQKEFKSVEELDRWCKQNGYMYEERSKGYYSLTNGKDFTTAHVGNAYTPNPELIKVLEAWLHNRMSEQEARAKIMKITGDKNITDMMIHSPGGFIPVGNKGQWDSKKMVYAKWDEEKGRPSEEFAKITWLGDGKGGLVNVWKGSQMTSEKFGSNDLEELRRWAEQRIGNAAVDAEVVAREVVEGKEYIVEKTSLRNGHDVQFNLYYSMDGSGKRHAGVFKDKDSAVSAGKKIVGNSDTVSEYNAEIQRLTKKAEQLRRMGQGKSAMEVEKQIQQLQKELREYEIGNKKTNNLCRARNAIKTKNGMGVSELEAQIRKNKEFIRQQKMRMNGKSKPEQDDIAEGIREAEEEIDRMEMRIADLKETGNKKVKNKKFRIVQETPFGNVSLGEWEANSAQEAVKEFIDMNPAFANGKKGHIAAYDK